MRNAILIASVAVVTLSAAASAQRWGHGELPSEGVCFYKDPDFRGDYFCAGPGEDFGSVPSGMNDRISSIRIVGQAEVTVFKDIRFENRSSRFDYNVPNLKNEGWDDLISSFRVRASSG